MSALQQFSYQGYIIEGQRGSWKAYDPRNGTFFKGSSNFKKLKRAIREQIAKEIA